MTSNYKYGFYKGFELSCEQSYYLYTEQNIIPNLSYFFKDTNKPIDEYEKGFYEGIETGIEMAIKLADNKIVKPKYNTKD